MTFAAPLVAPKAQTSRIGPRSTGRSPTYDPKLVALSPDNFKLTIDGQAIRISFLRDTAGNGEYIRHRAFVAKRAASSVARRVDARVLRQRLAKTRCESGSSCHKDRLHKRP